jgi:hypothetical protein
MELGPSLANRPMEEIERVAILATLEATGGNKTAAARRLGLTARTLSEEAQDPPGGARPRGRPRAHVRLGGDRAPAPLLPGIRPGAVDGGRARPITS